MSIFRRSHRIYPGPDETDSIFKENRIELVSDVIVTHSTYPTTGVYSEDEVKGWEWSKTFPQKNLPILNYLLHHQLHET